MLTREHIFPKWLQRKLELWDRELNLLNDTSIRYRNLTIPACILCNGVILSKLENAVAESRGGADAGPLFPTVGGSCGWNAETLSL
jgi:hypothetical protein